MARLDDVCELNPKEPPFVTPDTLVSFIPMPAVSEKEGAILPHEQRPFAEVAKGYTRFRNDDVIFAKITPCMENGKIAVAAGLHNGVACGSTEFHVLRSRGSILPSYLWRFLRQKEFRHIAERHMTGAVGQRRVPAQFLRDTEIPLPPVAEQRRIVAKLDALSARSERVRVEVDRVPELAERYRRAILSAAFRGELTAGWRAAHRDLSSVAGELGNYQTHGRRRNHEIGSDSFDPPFEIPRQWRWGQLPALGVLDRGRSRHRPRNDPSLYGGPYPFIQTGDVRAAKGRLTSFSQTYNESGLAQSRLWPKGTLCITIAANIAETAILGIDACFPDSVVGFTANEAICNPFYVEFFIRTIRADLAAFAPATAQKNINLETLSAVHVPCAPVEEQIKVVECIEKSFASVDQFVSEAAHARALLDRLDQVLLAKAFRGELVSSDAVSHTISKTMWQPAETFTGMEHLEAQV
jgi:type I restriction enzyme S subunit